MVAASRSAKHASSVPFRAEREAASGGSFAPCPFAPSAKPQAADFRTSPIWRQLASSAARAEAANLLTVLVTEAPPTADLSGARRWEEFRAEAAPVFVPRTRSDPATIVYSSGTGGHPKGCVMTHENYLEQCVALTSLYPFALGFRYLSLLPTNHAIDDPHLPLTQPCPG